MQHGASLDPQSIADTWDRQNAVSRPTGLGYRKITNAYIQETIPALYTPALRDRASKLNENSGLAALVKLPSEPGRTAPATYDAPLPFGQRDSLRDQRQMAAAGGTDRTAAFMMASAGLAAGSAVAAPEIVLGKAGPKSAAFIM